MSDPKFHPSKTAREVDPRFSNYRFPNYRMPQSQTLRDLSPPATNCRKPMRKAKTGLVQLLFPRSHRHHALRPWSVAFVLAGFATVALGYWIMAKSLDSLPDPEVKGGRKPSHAETHSRSQASPTFSPAPAHSSQR